MHLQQDYDNWKQNSLLNMKTPQDWRPVLVGFGIIAMFLGAVLVKRYIDQKRQEGYELELS